MSASPMALVVTVMTADDDPRRFCRQLACAVNNGPMHLAQALAFATQVYPVRTDNLRGTATALRCEFRMRETGSPVTEQAARDLLDRMSAHQLLDAHFTDANGSSLGPVNPLLAAS